MIKIGLSRRKSWISKTILFFGKRKTGSAFYSHAFLLLMEEGLVIEETFFGLRIRQYEKVYSKIPHVLYRPKFFTKEEYISIKSAALRQVGTIQGIYGYTKLPVMALDALFKTYWFSKHIGLKHFKVCSQWIMYLLKDHYDSAKNWRTYSPDDIDDEFSVCKLFTKETFNESR